MTFPKATTTKPHEFTRCFCDCGQNPCELNGMQTGITRKPNELIGYCGSGDLHPNECNASQGTTTIESLEFTNSYRLVGVRVPTHSQTLRTPSYPQNRMNFEGLQLVDVVITPASLKGFCPPPPHVIKSTQGVVVVVVVHILFNF